VLTESPTGLCVIFATEQRQKYLLPRESIVFAGLPAMKAGGLPSSFEGFTWL